jgi:phosphoglycolate phosphatase
MNKASRVRFGRNYLFDLDGTLVDSLPGIAASIEHAVRAVGYESDVADWRPFVGPPLEKMIADALTGLPTRLLPDVAAAFREHYDRDGLLKTQLFPGVFETLEALHRQGCGVYVVTNKREKPAALIIGRLGLDPFLTGLSAADGGGGLGKVERTAELVTRHSMDHVVFVGDGLDDLAAADRVNATFYLASWGYGAARVLDEWPAVHQLHTMSELLDRSADSG